MLGSCWALANQLEGYHDFLARTTSDMKCTTNNATDPKGFYAKDRLLTL